MERFPENRKVKQIKGSSIERKFLIDWEKQMEALGQSTHSDQRKDCSFPILSQENSRKSTTRYRWPDLPGTEEDLEVKEESIEIEPISYVRGIR